ncbi:MAG: ATP-sensitive inward rectifier potassium channel 10 [Candidatus Omnitrophota bacterium]|nr:ATP-sensitive inward rectifier potassium channel 10 [Candidatus Omnitrophota bacterium]MDZ4241286.1 ATP-sensitive inward rectifier potassium channel 10 [Candidatus Omnitrophota bacterium]
MTDKKKQQQSAGQHVVINRDGTLNIHRPREKGRFFFDLYHYLLAISWPGFFSILVLFFFASNMFFSALYFFAGAQALTGAHPDLGPARFADCFFFSVQLFNGPFKPSGLWPNILVVLQSYLGMLAIVIMTGILYARFARPRARVIFSNSAVISRYNHKPCLVFRVANERLNQIVEAHMNLTLTKNETSQEGEASRKFYPMKVENDYSPLFALSWTIRHFIDEDSPLYGMDEEKMREEQVAIFASLSGLDDTFSQTITARSVYRYDEIVFNKRFKDILQWKNNKMHINLQGIHDLE